jgi:hypothetical protein
MKKSEAFTVSIGALAAVDTYLTATVVPVPVWITFIAWASFYVVGGGTAGLKRSVLSNLAGLAISSLTLLAIHYAVQSPLSVAIAVGLGSAAMVQASKLHILNILPAVVWGFASTVGSSAVTATPITTLGLDNPAVVAATALIIGGLFGYVSEVLGNALHGGFRRLA